MKKAVFGFILTLFLLGAVLTLAGMQAKVKEWRELDYGEGIVLWQASQISDLKNAFHPVQQYPHVVFHYTPLYHVVVRILTRVLPNPLLSGRLVSMMATLWLAILFGWVIFQVTRGYALTGMRWFGAMFACAWVFNLPAIRWVPLARVDMLGLALEFTALSLLIVSPSGRRNQIAAFALLLLGLYTKQSLLALPAASILLLGLVGPARAIWFSGSLVAVGLSILFIFAWATDGGVIQHWFLYNVNPFHLRYAFTGELDASTNSAVLIAIGLAAFWFTLPKAPPRGWHCWWAAASSRIAASPLRRTGLGFGLAATLGFVTSLGIAKEGANINYCLDWQLALCPLAGLFLVLCLRGSVTHDHGMAFLRPLLALLLGATALQFDVQAALTANTTIGLSKKARDLNLRARRAQADLVKLISTFPGPVVSVNMLALLLAGKSVPFEPAIIKQLTDTGIFDETPLVKRTSARFFDAFVLRPEDSNSHFSPRMLEAIRKNYRAYPLDGSVYLVYVRQ